MSSGVFTSVLIQSIDVGRDERQRKKLTGIEELADSISNVGLINPIVITRDGRLVAGERRLTACASLGHDSIVVQYAEDLDTATLQLIELEENVKRVDLAWQDRVDAVARYHALKREAEPTWGQEATAQALGMGQQTVNEALLVADAYKKNADIAALPNFSTALNRVRRAKERAKSTATHDIAVLVSEAVSPITDDDEGEPAPLLDRRPVELINSTFQDFTATYTGPQFNFVHCDFPYGVNAGDKVGQSGAGAVGGYADKPEDYFKLLDFFLTDFAPLHVAPEAHCMFWFSMDFFEETVLAFEEADWNVNPFPLIWHKTDNKGIIPDTNRGPRRIYETALLCTRGDRFITMPVANCVGAATTREYHMSEKPHAMLAHFFRMLVDESTVMLDPTCGGGMSVKVAEEHGAKSAVGVEMSEEYWSRAKENLAL